MTLRITPALYQEFRRFNAAQQRARDAYALVREAEKDVPKRGRGRPREVIQHGTEGGYRAHRRRSEPACKPCLRAAKAAETRRKQQK